MNDNQQVFVPTSVNYIVDSSIKMKLNEILHENNIVFNEVHDMLKNIADLTNTLSYQHDCIEQFIEHYEDGKDKFGARLTVQVKGHHREKPKGESRYKG